MCIVIHRPFARCSSKFVVMYAAILHRNFLPSLSSFNSNFAAKQPVCLLKLRICVSVGLQLILLCGGLPHQNRWRG